MMGCDCNAQLFLVVATGKDVLSKFVHGSTNEPAARKAVELLDKCGVKGVGTRGHFYDKLKSVVIGILLWRMVSAACACPHVVFAMRVYKLMI
eukprot:COSAG02_NODE_1100_length_14582_cov_130.690672_8_plen_93_part_00